MHSLLTSSKHLENKGILKKRGYPIQQIEIIKTRVTHLQLEYK